LEGNAFADLNIFNSAIVSELLSIFTLG